MVIVGANGFAKEVLEIFTQKKTSDRIAFYDDMNLDRHPFLYQKFPILQSEEEVLKFFLSSDASFTIGVGKPSLRYFLFKKFIGLGGKYVSTISPLATIGSYEIEIGTGTNILAHSIVSNSVSIGIGCIVYFNVVITHDCVIGDFVELSPKATILGGASVGSYTQIGAGSTLLPNIRVGKNVVIGAGSVVTKDIKDNCVAFGTPARVIRNLEPLEY